jgi:hypothetical protein
MAEDDYAHEDARRMYRMYHFALACAEKAENWHLRAQILCSMAFQASWAGDSDTGLTYTESALVRADRLTATERAMLHNSRGRDRAQLGREQDALRAVGTADEEFSNARAVENAPWMASYTVIRHNGFAGNILWELGMQGQFVAETRDRLSTAIAARVAGRAQVSSVFGAGDAS